MTLGFMKKPLRFSAGLRRSLSIYSHFNILLTFKYLLDCVALFGKIKPFMVSLYGTTVSSRAV